MVAALAHWLPCVAASAVAVATVWRLDRATRPRRLDDPDRLADAA